jgi:hypothetical protein
MVFLRSIKIDRAKKFATKFAIKKMIHSIGFPYYRVFTQPRPEAVIPTQISELPRSTFGASNTPDRHDAMKHMLRSTMKTVSAPASSSFRGSPPPHALAVYASYSASPSPHLERHDFLGDCNYTILKPNHRDETRFISTGLSSASILKLGHAGGTDNCSGEMP